MEVMRLIDELEDVIEDARGMGKSVFINKSELLEIITEIRLKLPDEIKQAQWIKDEKQRILQEARKDAEGLMKEAEFKAEDLVKEDLITREAQAKATEIIETAQDRAAEIMLGAYEYADNIFLAFGEKFASVGNLVEKNRMDLKKIAEKIQK
ncbi:MAG: ATPase [Tissierellia bacterium]|nr:ATPase [Tissierellia bacterium]